MSKSVRGKKPLGKAKTRNKAKPRKKSGARKKASPTKPAAKNRRKKIPSARPRMGAELAQIPLGSPAAGTAALRAKAVDPKLTAVVGCVNGVLDANNAPWHEGDVMGADLGYTTTTMPIFLSQVKACLVPKHYTLTPPAIAALVGPCLAATVAAARL